MATHGSCVTTSFPSSPASTTCTGATATSWSRAWSSTKTATARIAVSRGDGATRLVTMRNLGWKPVTRRVKLDASIGFTGKGPVEVRQFHPTERILGTFKRGDEVEVEVRPFRSCLLLADAETDGRGRPCRMRLSGGPRRARQRCRDRCVRPARRNAEGFTARRVEDHSARRLSTASRCRSWRQARRSRFPSPARRMTRRGTGRLGAPEVCAVPADAETLFESTCFAADNDPLEIRSLRRSGPSAIPQVQKARQAFLEQPDHAELGILQEYLFDGNPETVYDLLRPRKSEPGQPRPARGPWQGGHPRPPPAGIAGRRGAGSRRQSPRTAKPRFPRT